jgi:hypothetical protein
VASPLSRRSFLKRSGLLAGAAWLGGLGAAGPAAARRGRADLSFARERTYAALVGAVAAAQGARAGPRHVTRVTGGFRSWYRASLPHVRAGVDAVLDDLERQAGGRFARMDRSRRVRLLQTTPARATVAQAVALAGPPHAHDAHDELRPSAAAV